MQRHIPACQLPVRFRFYTNCSVCSHEITQKILEKKKIFELLIILFSKTPAEYSFSLQKSNFFVA